MDIRLWAVSVGCSRGPAVSGLYRHNILVKAFALSPDPLVELIDFFLCFLNLRSNKYYIYSSSSYYHRSMLHQVKGWVALDVFEHLSTGSTGAHN